MADNVTWNDSDFQLKSSEKLSLVTQNTIKAVNDVAHQLLLVSQREVPIHTVPGEPGGDLARSGMVKQAVNPAQIEAVVGYNKVYAAYQHEGQRKDGSHVVSHYTNPRSKKKFLEDPLKANLAVFKAYFARLLG